MNEVWFAASKKERLVYWRKFRKTLVDLPLIDALQSCVDWWKMVPMSAHRFDPFDDSKWVSPWDLVWSGEFDEDSVALGMAYTIQLDSIAQCEVLFIQKRHDNNGTKLVVLVDNEYILNYNYGTVDSSDILNSCDILFRKKID